MLTITTLCKCQHLLFLLAFCLYHHAVKRHYGVRTDRYKLIHFYNDIDVWELYDLQNDPMEMHNIYNEPGNEALIDSLKTELNKLQEQYDDPIETELATAKK